MNDDRLLEPAKAYRDFYEREFDENARAYFQNLIDRSRIDLSQNRETTKKYRSADGKARAVNRNISKFKGLRVFLIVMAVIAAIVAVIGAVLLAQGSATAGGICLGVGIAAAACAILIVVLVVNRKIKKAQQLFEKHTAEAEKFLREAWEQMAPLNALFESRTTHDLIEKTVPLLQIDDNFSMRRYDYLHGKYGFGENTDTNRSTVALVSGEILGNPFVVDRTLVQGVKNHTYTGFLVIHWTTSHRDSKGKMQTQHHTQTLTAFLQKPKPEYSTKTRLIYGNDAAPDLKFSHEPTHAEKLSEKSLESKVKSGAKKIKKQQAKALKKGNSNFTEMANEEFDVLFNALDRNNEVQFRLMFTPLAQKNMLELMKGKDGFGDDFDFLKRGCLNYISSEHSARWDMDTSYKRYYSFDVDEAQAKFLSFNKAYFKSLFFDFAPILSVPLYQQLKPREYIYSEKYWRNLTGYETEVAVNALGDAALKHPNSDTPAILKTEFMCRDGKSDAVRMTAYSYHVEKRVDFVPVLGGDGRLHPVPVPWDEYIPIKRESVVKLKELPLSDRQFFEGAEGNALRSALKTAGASSFKRGVLCCLIDDINASFDAVIDKKINAK